MANDEKSVEMTAAEREFISDFTKRYCRPHAEVVKLRLERIAEAWRRSLVAARNDDFLMAAGPAAGGADARSDVAAPDEEVDFTFAGGEDSAAWRATLRIPPRATADTMLRVELFPRAAGVLRVAGCSLPMADGAAEIPFGLFLAGIKDVDVSFTRPDGTKTPGCLMFF